jgi:hypothetical protein
VISKGGGTRQLPYAFRERGVLMLSNVLNSERVDQVNIQIMRTFAKLREMLANHRDLLEPIPPKSQRFNRVSALINPGTILDNSSPQKHLRKNRPLTGSLRFLAISRYTERSRKKFIRVAKPRFQKPFIC